MATKTAKVTYIDVATEPFGSNELKGQMRGSVMVAEQRSGLTPLKVVFNHSGSKLYLMPGDVVYVRGDDCKLTGWPKEILTDEDGTKFILVPEGRILMTANTYEAEEEPQPAAPVMRTPTGSERMVLDSMMERYRSEAIDASTDLSATHKSESKGE